jgi:hypothetical protein
MKQIRRPADFLLLLLSEEVFDDDEAGNLARRGSDDLGARRLLRLGSR